ncbi:MAG TPA: hypothetical protein VK986_18045, partial [Tepidisphaeraceae bacterium]|nr:hypothetical protein [Tepidisphaeraceae bacterium]
MRTIDGKSYEGAVVIDPSGKLTVGPAGKGTAVELSNVLYARVRDDADEKRPTPERAGGDQPAVQTEGGKLPPGWEAGAVGKIAEPLYAKYADGVYSIKSAGGEWSDIGRREAYCFVRATGLPGDAEVVARLVDVKDGKRVTAGLVARADKGPESVYVGVAHVDGVVKFVKRTKEGERATAGAGRPGSPVWLRLLRKGKTVSAYVSGDGRTWDAVGTETLNTDGPLEIGLAVSGAARTDPLGAHFDNVRATA